MKKITLALVLIFLTVTLGFAGDEMTIKAFDRTNLNRLNNILRQLQRDNVDLRNQIKTLNGGSVAVETRQSGEMYVPQSNIVGFQGDSGQINLYAEQEGEQINIGVPGSGMVHKTLAGQAIPSSYFLDLRGIYLTAAERQFTADWLTLHDDSTPQNTVGLSVIDETNSIVTAGPIAGGRDQAAAFAVSTWLHFFIIYDPNLGDVSSLSSLSATAPTLPSGYTYFVRVGCSRTDGSGDLITGKQIDNKAWNKIVFELTGNDGAAGVLDISSSIPATAKTVWGQFGMRASPAAARWMRVGVEADNVIRQNFLTGGASSTNPRTHWFDLPIRLSQRLDWSSEGTAEEFIIIILGFIDDL